jgi:hypothetical protein
MATRRPKRPRDPNQLGKLIVDISTGATADKMPQLPPSPASEFARLGGLKGGPARAAKLSATDRSRIARKAAQKRWSRDRTQPSRKNRDAGK